MVSVHADRAVSTDAVFKKIVAGSTDNELNVLMIIMLGFLSVMPFSEIFGVKIGFYIPVYTVYPCYLFLGYMIYKKTFAMNRVYGGMLLLINSAIIITSSVYASRGCSLDLSPLWEYSSIFVVLQSVGIYLLHIIFLKMILKNYGFNPYEHGGFAAIVVIAICAAAVSYIITKVLKLIPVVNRII